MPKEVRVVYRTRQYIKPLERINMIKVLSYTTLITSVSVFGLFMWLYMLTSWSVSERDVTADSLNEVITRVESLEISETAWVDPLSITKSQLTDRIDSVEKALSEVETLDEQVIKDLETTINATRDTFLLHRDYHTLFSDETLLIIRALGMYESISWVDDQDSVIFKLGLQINLINDEKLSEVFVEVTLGEVSSEWLWMRLHYLLWTSLGGDY